MLRLADAQIKTRIANLRKPRTRDNEFEQEFQKGEAAGIELFVRLPEIAIADLKNQLQEMKDEPTE